MGTSGRHSSAHENVSDDSEPRPGAPTSVHTLKLLPHAIKSHRFRLHVTRCLFVRMN